MANIQIKTLRGISCLLMALLLLTGCGQAAEPKVVSPRGESAATAADPAKEPEEEIEETSVDETDAKGLYIIESFDGDEEFVILKHINSTRQVRYAYNLDTKFLNKYGDTESWSSFTPGKVVEIVETPSTESSTLASIQLSGKVWVQEGVTNYSMDLSRDIFKIADSNYRLTGQTEVFSHGIMANLTDIGEEDELRIIGCDKDIYSITVTSGHGYISLMNTGVFEGSLITVGDAAVALITENMVFEVPEGTYDVTVANDGYGGTKTVTVERNQTMILDLNELKGEGPKYCKITFQCLVEGAQIYLDGAIVTAEEQQDVRYGRHSLVVAAEGYDTWSRTLFVNSPSATIMLDLEDEKKNSSANSNSETNTNTGTSSDNGANTNANTNTNTNTNNSTSTSSGSDRSNYTEKDATLDYLSTISNMISSVTGN
ncbi:MAG: hypothetical protein K6A05_00895 [Lachnospiraceae bacterium]|nr:hypothetical protein [Lachnospiraceae bacterium]